MDGERMTRSVGADTRKVVLLGEFARVLQSTKSFQVASAAWQRDRKKWILPVAQASTAVTTLPRPPTCAGSVPMTWRHTLQGLRQGGDSRGSSQQWPKILGLPTLSFQLLGLSCRTGPSATGVSEQQTLQPTCPACPLSRRTAFHFCLTEQLNAKPNPPVQLVLCHVEQRFFSA